MEPTRRVLYQEVRGNKLIKISVAKNKNSNQDENRAKALASNSEQTSYSRPGPSKNVEFEEKAKRNTTFVPQTNKTTENRAEETETLRITFTQRDLLDELANWVSQNSHHGFPRTIQQIKVEKNRLCELHKIPKRTIALNAVLKFFKLSKKFLNVKFKPSSSDLLKFESSTKSIDHHNYLTSFLNTNSYSDILKDPQRIFFMSIVEYKDTRCESAPVLHTYSADGNSMTETIILRSGSITKRVFPKRKFIYRFTEDGNINENVLNEFVGKCFVTFVEEEELGLPVILFVDNLRSLINADTIKICEDKHIILLSAVSFVHMASPLSSLYCKSLKESFQSYCDLYESQKMDMSLAFPLIFEKVLEDADKSLEINLEQIAKQTVDHLGLYPWNKNSLNHDYLFDFVIREFSTPIYVLDPKTKFNMGNLLILGNDEILGNIDNKRKNIVSNTSFAQKNSFYIGDWIKDVYSSIVECTSAGLFLNVQVSNNFHDIYSEIRPINKSDILEFKNKEITLEHLVEWHKNCSKFLKQKNLLNVFQDASRISCFESFVFKVDANGLIHVHDNGNLDEENLLIIGQIVLGNGTILKPFAAFSNHSLVRAVKWKRRQEQVETIVLSMPSKYLLNICLKKLGNHYQSNEQKGPFILFINSYKNRVQLQTVQLFKKLNIIPIGIFPHSTISLNPIKIVINGLKDKFFELYGLKEKIMQPDANGEPTWFFRFRADFMMQVLLELSKAKSFREAFKKSGIFPWNHKNIDMSCMKKCEQYTFDDDCVVFKTENCYFPVSLHIGEKIKIVDQKDVQGPSNQIDVKEEIQDSLQHDWDDETTAVIEQEINEVCYTFEGEISDSLHQDWDEEIETDIKQEIKTEEDCNSISGEIFDSLEIKQESDINEVYEQYVITELNASDYEYLKQESNPDSATPANAFQIEKVESLSRNLIERVDTENSTAIYDTIKIKLEPVENHTQAIKPSKRKASADTNKIQKRRRSLLDDDDSFVIKFEKKNMKTYQNKRKTSAVNEPGN